MSGIWPSQTQRAYTISAWTEAQNLYSTSFQKSLGKGFAHPFTLRGIMMPLKPEPTVHFTENKGPSV